MANLVSLHTIVRTFRLLFTTLILFGSMTVSAYNAGTADQPIADKRTQYTSVNQTPISTAPYVTARTIQINNENLSETSSNNHLTIEKESNFIGTFSIFASIAAFLISLVSLLFSTGVFKVKRDKKTSCKEDSSKKNINSVLPSGGEKMQNAQQLDNNDVSNIQDLASQQDYRINETNNKNLDLGKGNKTSNVNNKDNQVVKKSDKQKERNQQKKVVIQKEEVFYVQPQMTGGRIYMIDCGESSKEYMPLKLLVNNNMVKVLFNEYAFDYVADNIETTIVPYAQCHFRSRGKLTKIVTTQPGKAFKEQDKWILTDKPKLDVL